ncbi:13139_t:CDS:1, partial [Funneliformis mosseae]
DRLEEYETERLINFLQKDSELSHIELGDGFFTRLEGKYYWLFISQVNQTGI